MKSTIRVVLLLRWTAVAMHTALALSATVVLATAGEARTLVVNPAQAGASDANPGSESKPLRTIGRAAALVRPCDLVRIHAGVYREKVTIERSGTEEQPIRFEAAPGEKVIVTGADLLTGWNKDADDTYSTAWRGPLRQADDRSPGGVNQVIAAGALLRNFSTVDKLAEGAYFLDRGRNRIIVRTARDLEKAAIAGSIEASTRAEIWVVRGSYVETSGLRFRYAANRAQQAMAAFQGDHDLVENCGFAWSNSTGASFRAPDITVRNCVFADNGQQGFTAVHAHRLHFSGCTVERNNVKNYERGWEAGGDKIVLTRGAVLENCRFLKNHGNGLWFDISNVDCTVRNCLFAENEDAGIFYEISYGLHAHDNVVVGNGLAKTPGAWGANGGICISNSPGCVIERNLIVGNEQGYCFREQNRSTMPVDGQTGPEVAVWNHDEAIRDNLIVNNRTAQVQGWFDIASERHWPRELQTGWVSGGHAKDDRAAGYQARKDGVPAGLSLKDLNITFQGNVYAYQPKQPFFVWGANWKRKQEFHDIPSLAQVLGFEGASSSILPTLHVDVVHRDFRLSAAWLTQVKHAYPRGQIPDCLLGQAE